MTCSNPLAHAYARRFALLVLLMGLSTATAADREGIGRGSTRQTTTPRLAFLQEPSDTYTLQRIAPAVQVVALNADGSRDTTFTGLVNVSLASNPGLGLLGGYRNRSAVAGVASFDNLTIDSEGYGYTLSASTPGLTSATSASFDVTDHAYPPVALVITQQPAQATATSAIAPPLTVELRDTRDELANWANQEVTVAIEANVGNSTLSGTTTVGAVGGVATFDNLSLNKVGIGYTLRFSSARCVSALSQPFRVVPGPAVSLGFLAQPTDVMAGAQFDPVVAVQLYDAGDNVAALDSTTVVNMALASGTNSTGATLGGTTSLTASAGVARFVDLFMDKAGLNYKLTATFSTGPTIISQAFDVTPGPAAALRMVRTPGDTAAGASLSPAPQVRVTDAYDNALAVTGTVVTATLQAATGTAPPLEGTVTAETAVGQATFPDLRITRAGSGYTLTFSSPGMASVVCPPFAIEPGSAVALAWQQAPTDTEALAPITPAPSVALLDIYGNRATNDNATSVDVTLGANPTGATLSGTLRRTAQLGLVKFADLALSRVGSGYTLVARATDYEDAVSAPFGILERSADPSRSTVTITPAVIGTDGETATLRIVLRDSLGLPVQGIPASMRTILVSPSSGLTITDSGAPSDDNGMVEIALSSSVARSYTVTPRIGGTALASAPLSAVSVFEHEYAAGLYCLGLPLYLTDGRPSAVLGATGWRMARYDAANNEFVTYSDAADDDPRFAFARARGHWVRFLAPTTLRSLGQVTPAQPFDVRLTQGWNCLANPFDGVLSWNLDQIKVLVGNDYQPLSDAATWDVVAPYAWYWDGTRNNLVFDPALPAFSTCRNSIPRTGGFWVWCASAGTVLRLPPPTLGAARAARSATTRDWALALNATGPDGAMATVTTGVSASLARGLRLAEPPRPVGDAGVGLAVVDGASRLAGDIRSWSAGAQSWDLLVTSPAPGSISLTWPSLLRSLPGGLTAELTDQQTGRALLLNTQSAYRFEATRAGEQRRLRLTVRPGHVQRSTITSLALVGGRAVGASVAISLTGPAEITLRVKGLGGQVVRETTTSATEAGTVQMSWDGADRDGRPVPAGTYQLEATAVAPNGAVSRAVRAITVR